LQESGSFKQLQFAKYGAAAGAGHLLKTLDTRPSITSAFIDMVSNRYQYQLCQRVFYLLVECPANCLYAHFFPLKYPE